MYTGSQRSELKVSLSFYESEGIELRRPPPNSQAQEPVFSPSTLVEDGQDMSVMDHGSPPQHGNTTQPQPVVTAPWQNSGSVPDATISPAAKKPATEPIIGHMGRLVSDDRGVAMFAGSTTGVHFVSQAEQHVQMMRMDMNKFPSCVYNLHLHDLWGFTSQKPSDFELVQAIMARLPPDTEDILLAAIERWTSIYPIVHPKTTINAFRGLVKGLIPSDEDIVAVHQILGLLALGTVGHKGQCTRDHYHFLCLSEVHYSVSATILEKVLKRPCLQTLQSLEIIQIYLHISARYTLASHLGGTATRLAQSLGLHRHSHRFRFDPLVTEIRRRVWWCQYSFDTFSSMYHGLPRLIRDQDVDTDLPTSVDHDLLSQSHVAFPLPGEGSQVDSALHLFRITRIVADALENLYTTTRRRGGVAKITRLQAELDMWARGLPGSDSSESTAGAWDSQPNVHGASMDPGAPAESFGTSFLRVVLCIATIQVHRPALSFTASHPLSTSSLLHCRRASMTLINLLATGLKVRRPGAPSHTTGNADTLEAVQSEGLLLGLLYPSGAHMLWQAGLTVLYAYWKLDSADSGHDDENDIAKPGVGRVEDTVYLCALALRRLGELTSGTTDSDGHRLGKCAAVLDMLRQKTIPRQQPPAEPAAHNATSGLPSGWDQVSWNVWDWPMESVLEFTNSMDIAPLDLSVNNVFS